MYALIVVALLLILPLLSVGTEVTAGGHMTAALLLKWYVFWAVGLRLALAGARQIVQPAYTARVILGLQSDESLLLVRELGLANIAIGVTAIASLPIPSWRTPAGVAGAIFYGLAGINHSTHKNRGSKQQLAMGSDLFAALTLILCVTQAA